MKENKISFSVSVMSIINALCSALFAGLWIYLGVNILRSYGVPIYNFTYWEVVVLRIALYNILPFRRKKE